MLLFFEILNFKFYPPLATTVTTRGRGAVTAPSDTSTGLHTCNELTPHYIPVQSACLRPRSAQNALHQEAYTQISIFHASRSGKAGAAAAACVKICSCYRELHDGYNHRIQLLQ